MKRNYLYILFLTFAHTQFAWAQMQKKGLQKVQYSSSKASSSFTSFKTSPNTTGQSSLKAKDAKPKTLKDSFKGSIKGSILIGDYSSELKNTTGSNFKLNVDLDFTPSHFFSIRAKPRLISSSGYTEAVEASAENESLLYIQEATGNLYLKPALSEVSLGVIDMTETKSDLLLYDRGFPGVRYYLHLTPPEQKKLALRFFAEAGIPTGRTLVLENEGQTERPLFTSGGMFFAFKESYIKASYFKYENLPSSIATKSEKLGTEVEPINETERVFAYNFGGWDSEFKVKPTDFFVANPFISGSYIFNNEAPQDTNSAYKIGGGIEFRVQGPWTITPFGYTSEIQSNSAPAAYMRSGYIPNTRGYRVGLEIAMDRFFKIRFETGEDKIIDQNIYQKDASTTAFRIESANVRF